jgi:hypothetical protein
MRDVRLVLPCHSRATESTAQSFRVADAPVLEAVRWEAAIHATLWQETLVYDAQKG